MYKLCCGDCLEIMKRIPDDSIDLIITDPPYKITHGGNTKNIYKPQKVSQNNIRNGHLFNCNQIKFDDWIPEIYRILKPTGHCYIMCNDKNLNKILNTSFNNGFKLLNILVWKKNKHSPNNWYLKNVEFIIMLRKGGAKKINNLGTKSLLEFNVVKNKLHPSEKPVELLECLINNSSNIHNVILDPFMGSGSTGVACKNLNRNFIGIELDENYFNIAKERIENN